MRRILRFAIVAPLVIVGLMPLPSVAQEGKFIGSIAPYRDENHNVNLQLLYVTSPPGGAALYIFCGQTGENPWRVYWSQRQGDKPTRAAVVCARDDVSTRSLILTLAAPVPNSEAVNSLFWTVLYTPPDNSAVLPQLMAFVPSVGLAAARTKKSCDSKSPIAQPAFCAPMAGVPPDIRVTGGFLAAGQTKPIYTLEVLANIYASSPLEWLWNFTPGFDLALETNQGSSPPNNRSRFDPDSIVVTADFMKIVPVQRGVLYGIQFDEALPGGEFSRTDQSSNVIFKSGAMLILNPWHPRKSRFYGTLYPVLAFEGGKNLNRPNMLAGNPISLTHYNAIVRGVLGADAAVGYASSDKKTDDITLTGSYRVHLPAFDEPFISTINQVTNVNLTTRARHWVQVDLSYSPASFKFLSITAQYQYGELPPVFALVDHKASIGFTFKASQTNKPALPSPVH